MVSVRHRALANAGGGGGDQIVRTDCAHEDGEGLCVDLNARRAVGMGSALFPAHVCVTRTGEGGIAQCSSVVQERGNQAMCPARIVLRDLTRHGLGEESAISAQGASTQHKLGRLQSRRA